MEELQEESNDQIELKIENDIDGDSDASLSCEDEKLIEAKEKSSSPPSVSECIEDDFLSKQDEVDNADNIVQHMKKTFIAHDTRDSCGSNDSPHVLTETDYDREEGDESGVAESPNTLDNHNSEDAGPDHENMQTDGDLDKKHGKENLDPHYSEQSQEKENDETIDATDSREFEDVLDFTGFDSTIVDESAEKKAKWLQILQDKEDEALKRRKSSEFDSGSQDSEVADMIFSEKNLSAGENDLSTSATAFATKASLTPGKPHTVYGTSINIFEEQLPTGSKRVKKKKTFFGDFDEAENEKTTKKTSVLSRPSQCGANLHISLENKENFINEDKVKSVTLAAGDAVTSPSDPSSHNKPRRSNVFNISNPLYKEPFKHGWKREICYRNLPEGSKSKSAYVAYFDPRGVKFKTIRDIVKQLPPDSVLNMKHFTYSRERIFSEPSEFEMIRHLNKIDLNESATMNDSGNISHSHQSTPLSLHHSKSSSKKKRPAPPSKLIIKKPKYLTQNDGEEDHEETSRLVSTIPSSMTPKIVIKTSASNSAKSCNSKTKVVAAKKDKKLISKKLDKNSKKNYESLENAESSLDVASISEYSALSPLKMNGDLPTCSISCPMALGSIPTLQCTVCLGSYHFECCGIDASLPLHNYVCKNCHNKSEVSSNLLLVVSQKSNATVDNASSRRVNKNTKIVDGVTTWLPSSSNVQLSSRHSTSLAETPTPLLQSILELEGKRYIVVPKQSLVSISPNTNSASSYVGHDGDEDQTCTDAEGSASYTLNSTDINSAGVVLVPVTPPHPHQYSDPRNQNKFSNLRNQGAGKRKLSDDLDEMYPSAKLLKLDNETIGYRYQSALTFSNMTRLYDALISCVKYLTVRDLLRISMSCKYLNKIASEPCLWSTVRLKNSRVWDWEGFANTLRKYGTKKLDMRKMLYPSSPDDQNTMWCNFLKVIPSVTSLEHIEFSRCNSSVVETVVSTCPNLIVVKAVQLRNGFAMEKFTGLKNLRELRLKGSNGLPMEPCDNLEFMCKNVQVLSLTSIKMLNSASVKAIGELRNLRILELGECSSESVNANQIAEAIGNLHNLEKLRLELLMNMDPDFLFQDAVKKLPNLKYLELVNVEIKAGFEKVLSACQQIEHLLIIPLYKSESSHSNRTILNSLEHMPKTLKTFFWGFTNELMKATAAYATQFFESSSNNSEDKKLAEKTGSDVIPVIKNLSDQPSVELVSLKTLDKLLKSVFPQTNIKLVTVSFGLTWRQSLSDILK